MLLLLLLRSTCCLLHYTPSYTSLLLAHLFTCPLCFHVVSYIDLYSPALEWMLQNIGYNSNEDLFYALLQQYCYIYLSISIYLSNQLTN